MTVINWTDSFQLITEPIQWKLEVEAPFFMQNKENKVRLTEPKPNRTQNDSNSVIIKTETEAIFMKTEPNLTHFGLTEASLLAIYLFKKSVVL